MQKGDCKLSAFDAFVSVHLSAARDWADIFAKKTASKVNLMHHERNPTRSGNHYTPRSQCYAARRDSYSTAVNLGAVVLCENQRRKWAKVNLFGHVVGEMHEAAGPSRVHQQRAAHIQ